MARVNVPLTNLTGNAGLVQPAGTAIVQASGANIQMASGAIPALSDAYLLVLQVANTGTTGFTIIRAGVQPPSFRNLLGDLSITVTTATTWLLGPFDPSRFYQIDGSINVDFATGFTGTIAAYLVPRSGF